MHLQVEDSVSLVGIAGPVPRLLAGKDPNMLYSHHFSPLSPLPRLPCTSSCPTVPPQSLKIIVKGVANCPQLSPKDEANGLKYELGHLLYLHIYVSLE